MMFVSVKQFTQQVLWNAMTAHDAIIASHLMQTHHVNRQRQAGENYLPGDRVYLSTKNLALPKGRAKKLLSKFIGPYKIIEAHTAASTVMLELPLELTAWRVHPTFHVDLIRAHMPNDNVKFPCCDMKSFYDFGATNEPELFINKILAHHWVDQADLEFQVCWTLGDMTCEPLALCKELTALDKYLELRGVKRPHDLLCKVC